jgi:hypothetical protein
VLQHAIRETAAAVLQEGKPPVAIAIADLGRRFGYRIVAAA